MNKKKAAPKHSVSVEQLTEILRAFGQHNSHFDDSWLYLPRLVCAVLGNAREEEWVACRWDSRHLLLFLREHWEAVWAYLGDKYNLDSNTIAILKRRSGRLTHRLQTTKRKGKSYTREYWVIPSRLVDILDFSVSTNDEASQQKPRLNKSSEGCHQCQFAAGENWIEVTPGWGFGELPLGTPEL